MHGFSTVDGFVEISECMAGMIKYLANEPSVGLFFVQQHAQKTVPNVIKHKKNVVQKSHETSLHTQDLEDSITVVRSMKECGFPIAEEMIGDIRKSLVTMATKQPKRGLIHPMSSNSETERMSSWGSFRFYGQESSERSGNYFSNVFMSARQKPRNLTRPQLDGSGLMDSSHKTTQQYHNQPLSNTSASTTSSLQGMETDEVHPSSQVEDEPQQHKQIDDTDKLLSVSEKYIDFKSTKEAQLEKWLEGSSNHDDNGQADDAERP